jgi:serine/threonine protein kinase
VALDSQAPEIIGRTIGEYEVVRKLGIGGMGIVYEGRHPVIGKRVAIKVLLPSVSGEKEVVERFLSEARAVNEIRHRGIVDIFSFGQLPEGSHYFIMEYLEGEPFDRIVKNRAPLPIGEALQWAEEMLDALESAHDAGIIHRDIKPSNLFLVNTGRGKPYVKLLDFGIAKLGAFTGGESTPQTRASVIMGTPDYISPEQARGRPISNRTDLYALGCVIFELLTGKRVFKSDNPLQTMWMHVEDPPPVPSSLRPDIPQALSEMVLWALQKNPEDRPPSAAVMKETVALIRGSLLPGAGSLTPSPGSGQFTLPAALTPPPSIRAKVLQGTPIPGQIGTITNPSNPSGSISRSGLAAETRMQPIITSNNQPSLAVEEEATSLGIPEVSDGKLKKRHLPTLSMAESAQKAQKKFPVWPVVIGALVLVGVGSGIIALGAKDLNAKPPSEFAQPLNPLEMYPAGYNPADVKPVEAKPIEAKPIDVKPVDVKPVDVKPVDVKPVDVKPVDVKPVDVKPVDVKPINIRPSLTNATLMSRLKKLEAKLAAKEEKAGEPDKMLRQFVNEARRTINSADSDAKRKEAATLLDDVAAQMK